MSEEIPSDKGPDTVSLADEEGAKRILVDTVFGLWAIVNNLMRLRPSKRERYRVTIFGSARTQPGHWVYGEVKRMAAGIAASAIAGLQVAGVSVVGTIHGGFSMPVLPRPSLFEAMWPAAAGIALISFTESIAAARAFVRRDDPHIDVNRELLAIGVANAAGAFIGAMPAGGGTSQTAAF